MNALYKKIIAAPSLAKRMMLHQFLEGLVPIMALYPIMFERTGGLSFQQIGYLFAIWGFVFVIFELPSGVLADYWSRKGTIILGGIMRAIGFTVWLLWPGFTGYAIGFALWGGQIAMSSGAVSAYVENELAVQGKAKQFTKYFGWVTASFWFGTLFGHGLAALLTLEFADTLIIMSAVSSLLYAVLMLFNHESDYKRQPSYFKTMKAGLTQVRSSKKLQYICFVLFSIYMIIGVIEELLPRVYASFGLNDTAVSLLLAAALSFTVFLVSRLESAIKASIPRQVAYLAMATLLLITGITLGGAAGTLLVLGFSLVFQLFRPVFQHYVIKYAKGDEKATVASVPGLFGGVIGPIAYVIIGSLSSVYGENRSIALYAGCWAVLLLFASTLGMRLFHGLKKSLNE